MRTDDLAIVRADLARVWVLERPGKHRLAARVVNATIGWVEPATSCQRQMKRCVVVLGCCWFSLLEHPMTAGWTKAGIEAGAAVSVAPRGGVASSQRR
jgi:hypothetical protein